jgi:hypothetical protein
MTCPSMQGTISIGVCGVFLALHSTSSVHGAIVAVVAVVTAVTVVAIVDGEYLRRVFIQTDSDGFNAGSGSCDRSCGCLFQPLADKVR